LALASFYVLMTHSGRLLGPFPVLRLIFR